MLDMLRETRAGVCGARVCVLDLTVWRTSCAQVEEDPLSKQDALGRDRRVRCRTDVIVRSAILFLENKPVEEAIRKMVDSGY